VPRREILHGFVKTARKQKIYGTFRGANPF